MKTLKEIIEKETTSHRYYTGAIRIWNDVKIVTKKDGGRFAVYSKNFENAKIQNDFCGYKITVHGRDDNNKWFEDWIRINATDEYGKHTGEPLPVETVENLIKKTIENYERNAMKSNNRIAKAEKVYNIVKNHIDAINKELEEIDDGDELKYIAMDLVESAKFDIGR